MAWLWLCSLGSGIAINRIACDAVHFNGVISGDDLFHYSIYLLTEPLSFPTSYIFPTNAAQAPDCLLIIIQAPFMLGYDTLVSTTYNQVLKGRSNRQLLGYGCILIPNWLPEHWRYDCTFLCGWRPLCNYYIIVQLFLYSCLIRKLHTRIF